MFRVFNIGIGLILILPTSEKEKVFQVLNKYLEYKVFEIGQVVNGNKKVILK